MSTTYIDNNGVAKLINPQDTSLILLTPDGYIEHWTSVRKMSIAHGFGPTAVYQKISKNVEGVRVRKWDGYTLASIPKNYKGAFRVKLLDREVIRKILGEVKV
jgi:hypothetical protein